MIFSNRVVYALLLLTLLFSSRVLSGVEQFSISSGATYLVGDYGLSDDTSVLYFPLTGKYRKENWTFKLTVPYLVKKGPRNVLVGIGSAGTQSTVLKTTTESGLGDIVTSIRYNLFYHQTWNTLIDLEGKVKFGTASGSKALGTGETDYALNVGIYKVFDKITPYTRAGYQFYGDSPRSRLNDGIFGSAGISYKLTPTTTGGLDFSLREKAFSSGTTRRQLVGYVSHKLDKHWTLGGHIIKGFGRSSLDWGGGMSIEYFFE